MRLDHDLFVIEKGEGRILYAPLNKAAASVNIPAAAAVEKYVSGKELSNEEAGVIAMLQKYDFFEKAEEIGGNPGFRPVEVTLFPSSGCNLRCAYCYAWGGENPIYTMSAAVAEAAVDIVIKNAAELNREYFKIGFHGNGEPFTAFPMIKECVRYAYDQAEAVGLKPYICAASNGVFTDEMTDFVLAYFNSINISFDVLPELQNSQRPFPDGSGSHSAVMKTLKRLDMAGFDYGIRTTLSDDTVGRMGDIVDYVGMHFPNCTLLHIEPVWESGRCLATNIKTPHGDRFAAAFLEQTAKFEQTATKLVYSSARQDFVANGFCGASQGGFTVTADGLATACYEVCDLNDPRSDIFVFGGYDERKTKFVFDKKKLERLAGMKVENIDFCSKCFCKWHCAGDCPAKLMPNGDPKKHRGSGRCHITKAITLKQIEDFLNQ